MHSSVVQIIIITEDYNYACMWVRYIRLYMVINLQSANWHSHKMVPLFSVFLFVAVGCFRPGPADAKNPVFFLPAAQTTVGESQHLATSNSSGNVFVSAGTVLYRLSSELQLLQSVPVSASVVGLTTTADGDWLVACFNTRSCTVYDSSDLTNVNATIIAGGIYPPGSSSVALFTATSIRDADALCWKR